jgi:arylsulfatase A-like enzyme
MSGAGNLERAEARGMVPILVGKPVRAIPQGDDPLGPTPMLPGWLRDAGTHSRLFTTNGFFSRAWGNAQGFDEVTYPGPMGTPALYEIAKASLDADPLPEPWYLHLHLFEPHRPYTPPEEYLDGLDALPDPPFPLDEVGQQNLAEAVINDPPDWLPDEQIETLKAHMRVRYAAEVRRFDDALRDVWADLEARGLLDDALVVFWTDHGEALWEHGTTTAHAKLLHRDENDALAFFWADNIVPTAWTGPTRQADLVPTVLQALGIPQPPEVTGIPIGLAPEDRPRFALTDGARGPVQSVRDGRWLMHFQWQGTRPGLVELFDIEADPDTQVDLFDPEAPSDEALRLWALLKPKVLEAEPWIAEDPRPWVISWPEALP